MTKQDRAPAMSAQAEATAEECDRLQEKTEELEANFKAINSQLTACIESFEEMTEERNALLRALTIIASGPVTVFTAKAIARAAIAAASKGGEGDGAAAKRNALLDTLSLIAATSREGELLQGEYNLRCERSTAAAYGLLDTFIVQARTATGVNEAGAS